MPQRRGRINPRVAKYRAPAEKTSRQMTKEIREHMGWEGKEHRKEWLSYYNTVLIKIRNFEKDTGAHGKINPSQFLYDIHRRQLRAEKYNEPVQYTQEQELILGYTSTFTTNAPSRARLERAVDLLTGENGVFRNLLEQSIYVKEKFDIWLERYRKYHPDEPNPPPRVLNAILRGLADDVHRLRASVRGKAKDFYNKYGRRSRS